MREPVSLGYLLARFTDTIADAPGIDAGLRLELLSQTALVLKGELEGLPGITSISQTLSHDGERELVSRSAELFDWYREIDERQRDHLSEVILTIIHGQQWDATYFEGDGVVACESESDLLRYTYWVAGCVGEFWTKVAFTSMGSRFADPEQAESMLMSGRKLGQALQLTNILRDLYEDLPQGRCYLPGEELLASGWDGSSPVEVADMNESFDKWLGICEQFLEQSDDYVWAVRNPRVRLCTRLPKLLAEKTVRQLRAAGPEKVMSEKVKISRGDVWSAMAQATFF
tara:strand:+ start:1021 stop:1878 length:858 start_codon:yes stop_codon:yes gene_type:complete